MGQQEAFLEPLAPPSPDFGPTMGPTWRFEVLGEAVPQGSMKALISKNTGHPMVKADNETALNRWRREIERTAKAHLPPWLTGPEGEPAPYDGPVFLALIVTRKRSPRDYLADGVTLRKGARRYPDTAPDSDKLARAFGDALEGIAVTNDARIVSLVIVKRYTALGEDERVVVEIAAL